jgi:transcriptional regulator with XRE-family HTH domain
MLLNGMTRKEVACSLGIGVTTINNILTGNSYISLQAILQPRLREVFAEITRPPDVVACTKCRRMLPRTTEFFQPIKRASDFETRCKSCAALQRRDRHQKYRLDTLRHYGGDPPRCACCDERLIEFLAIDHVNGGGNAHRREIKRTRSASSFSLWLKQEGYPPGYRVLCHNCNMAIGFYGRCPHKGSK